MPRGRPPKPNAQKKLEGSRQPLMVEVFAPHGAPFVPDHLHDDAQRCAEHIIANFSARHISALDSYILSVFCSAWAWHKAAVHAMSAPDFDPVCDQIEANGRRYPRPNPWFKIMNEQAQIMLQAAPKLFLTPRDRHLIADLDAKKSKSKFDGLIGRKTSSASVNYSSSRQE